MQALMFIDSIKKQTKKQKTEHLIKDHNQDTKILVNTVSDE